MKKITGIVIGFCLAYAANAHADGGTFNQRFGVNGYLTSLPLYYKDNSFYSKYKRQNKLKQRKIRKAKQASYHSRNNRQDTSSI